MSEKRIIRVGDVMGSKLYTIDRLATVAEAMALLKQYEVSSLAVNGATTTTSSACSWSRTSPAR